MFTSRWFFKGGYGAEVKQSQDGESPTNAVEAVAGVPRWLNKHYNGDFDHYYDDYDYNDDADNHDDNDDDYDYNDADDDADDFSNAATSSKTHWSPPSNGLL